MPLLGMVAQSIADVVAHQAGRMGALVAAGALDLEGREMRMTSPSGPIVLHQGTTVALVSLASDSMPKAKLVSRPNIGIGAGEP